MSLLLQGKQSWYRFGRDTSREKTEISGSTEEDGLAFVVVSLTRVQDKKKNFRENWNLKLFGNNIHRRVKS